LATSFPTGLDALTNPTSADGLNSPDHAGQHANVNDAVEALEAKVGVDGSAVTSSLDYKVTNGIFSALAVDTNVLVVDATNNRVGVGTVSPTTALDVIGTTTLKTVKAGSGAVAISGATYTPAFATSSYTTTTPHGFATGDTVAVTGITPSSWNRTATITKASSTSFFFSLFNGSTGGAYSSGGTATGPPSTLYVDTTNDRIGIGTSSPTEKLDVVGNIALTGSVVFEGATADAFETTLSVTDPTADRTITLPNASGTVALTSDPGLILVKTQTVGTGVSSVTVTDAFSSDFDDYKIIVSGGVGSTTATLNMTLGATATGYYFGALSMTFASASSSSLNGSNTTSWSRAGIVSTNNLNGEIELFSPNLAKRTHYNGRYVQSIVLGNSAVSGGFLDNATQYTDFTLTPSTGTLTGGTIRVYGYRNS
jgi:hypothetical protein